MQNIPRIYLNETLDAGKTVPVDKDVVHYLRRVMRRNDCLVFNSGNEYTGTLSGDDKFIIVGEKTPHVDSSNNLTLCFAPIKKMEELLNMATQMGVAFFQPVVTQRTVAHHVNWTRMNKIIIEASEQSNRNSVPKILPPIKFDELDLDNLIVADERFAHNKNVDDFSLGADRIFIGPEGGFSDSEFEKMDGAGVQYLSLGKTILRAEVAAVVAITKVLNK